MILAVTIMLSIDAAADAPSRIQYFQLRLPVAIGTTVTTVYPGTGAPGVGVTLDVTSTTLAPSGPGLVQAAGTFSGEVTGAFTASVCPRLTTSCI